MVSDFWENAALIDQNKRVHFLNIKKSLRAQAQENQQDFQDRCVCKCYKFVQIEFIFTLFV